MTEKLLARYEAEKKAKAWLSEEGYQIVDVQVKGDPRITWAFGVLFSPAGDDQSQQKMPIVLVGREGLSRVDCILEGQLLPAHQEILNSDGFIARAAMRQLRERLFLHGTGLAFQKGADGKIGGLRLDDVVYTDAPFTKDRLMSMLRRLYAVMLYAGDHIRAAADKTDRGVEPAE